MNTVAFERSLVLPGGERIDVVVPAAAIDRAAAHPARGRFLEAMARCEIPALMEHAMLSSSRHPVVVGWRRRVALELRRWLSYPAIAGAMGRASHSSAYGWVNPGTYPRPRNPRPRNPRNHRKGTQA